MAGPGSDADQNLLQVGGQGQSYLQNLRIDEPVVRIDKSDGDYLDQLGKMAADRQRAADDSTSLRLDLNLALGDLFGPGEEQLRLARELIEAEQYREALTPLAEALAQHPDLREAIYLKGLCQTRLDEHEEALVTLYPLLAVRLPHDLQDRINILRDEITGKLTPQVLTFTILMAVTGSHETARQHAQRFVELAPEVGLYHCLLAGILMRAGRIAEALNAAEYGLQVCRPPDRPQIVELKSQLDQQDLEVRLEQARLFYRMGNYPLARHALDTLEPRHKQQQLWITFNGYLNALGGRFLGLVRGKRPDAVQPQGRFKDVDRLHFLLAREEVAAAKAALNADQPAQAVAAARQAIRYTPFFPYAHFLLGTAIHRHVFEEVTAGRMATIEQMVALIEEAQEHANIGLKDPEIGAAADLVASLASTRQMFGEIAARIEKDKRDADLMNPIMKDFVALSEKLKGGIKNQKQFYEIKSGLESVRSRAKAAQPKLHGQDSQDACRRIIEMIDSVLT